VWGRDWPVPALLGMTEQVRESESLVRLYHQTRNKDVALATGQ